MFVCHIREKQILTQGKNRQMAANFLEANFEYFRVLHAVSDYKKRVEFQTSRFLFFFQDFIQFLFLIFLRLYSLRFLNFEGFYTVVSYFFFGDFSKPLKTNNFGHI